MLDKASRNRPLRGLDLCTAFSGLCWRRYANWETILKFTTYLVLAIFIFTPRLNAQHLQIDDAFFEYLSENYKNLDKDLIHKSSERHTESAIKLSNQMMISGELEQIAHGEELLLFLAERDPRALFSLGSIYRQGVEIFPEGGTPQRVLRDYEGAAHAFLLYLEEYRKLSPEMTQFAYAYAGEALVDSAQYEAAAELLLGDVEMAKKESTGLAAFTIGNLYLNGDAVEEDKSKALYWFDMAANKGLGIAEVERNFLRSELGE